MAVAKAGMTARAGAPQYYQQVSALGRAKMTREKPYAVGYCLRNDMVILRDGSHAEMKDWLDEDFERVIPTGPETPKEARWLAYDYHGRPCCTDVHWVQHISMH